MRVDDFNAEHWFVRVQQSKSGRPRDVYLTSEGARFFTSISAGRAGDAVLLPRDGRAWRPTEQTRFMLLAKRAASISGGSFHSLRHSAASHWIMNGVSLEAVSKNLGHATSVITSKVYAHLTTTYRADQFRAHGPDFGTTEEEMVNVVPIRV